MRKILTSLMLVASAYSFAQVSISANTDDAPRATLDVKALNDLSTPDGVLIPKVDKDRAQSMVKPEVSTLVYIENTGNGGARTVDVDAEGFYYFNGTKWVKLGSGAVLKEPKKTMRVVAHIKTSDWDDDQFALVQTGEEAIQLPDPAENMNRIISVTNQAGTTVSYAVPNPLNNSSIRAGKGQLLMSDGTDWQVIAGF